MAGLAFQHVCDGQGFCRPFLNRDLADRIIPAVLRNGIEHRFSEADGSYLAGSARSCLANRDFGLLLIQ